MVHCSSIARAMRYDGENKVINYHWKSSSGRAGASARRAVSRRQLSGRRAHRAGTHRVSDATRQLGCSWVWRWDNGGVCDVLFCWAVCCLLFAVLACFARSSENPKVDFFQFVEARATQ